MSKFILLLIMLLPSVVFGASFDDEWPIYVYGDANYYKLIYDGIAMTAQDTVFMDEIFKLAFAASLLFAAYNFFLENLKGAMYNVAAGLGVVGMLLYPTSTVHILDVRTLHGFVYPEGSGTGDYTGYSKVDNVPFYLAVVPSFATALKYYIIDVATDALTPIEGGSFRDSGFATPMTLADDMIGLSSFKYSKDSNYTAPKFQQALSHYIENCIIKEAIYVDKGSIFGVMDPKGQQLDALKPANFGFGGTNIPNINGVDDGTTCSSFWTSEIDGKTTAVGNALLANLQDKNPKIDVGAMANAISDIAGLESNASVGSVTITNAMLNIATTGTLLSAFEKAGAGLSGIDLSNSMAAKQSLFANMTDSTGQFKWMIRVIPVLEFLIFGVLIYLGFLMGIVAGFSGAEKGGKMIMNYAAGMVAFSFIDVALAIVQAISTYYYNTKMMDAMVMLGQNPFTATNLPLYMQETAYMSGMMGLAAVLVVPLVVSVVFKGETMAAMGAYNSVAGKYKGDGGGQNLSNSLSNSSAVHAAEAQEYEEAARRELAGGYGITSIPSGALASQMLERISAEAAGYSGNIGARNFGNQEFGSNQEYIEARAKAGMGSGTQRVAGEIGSGLGLKEAIDENPNSLHNFMTQSGSDAASGFSATAKKGALSESNPLLTRENQIEAAEGNAETDLRKMVASGLGASKAFKDGLGDDFSYQVQTDSEASIASQAAKGEASQNIESLSRDNQVISANALAVKGMEDQVGSGLGLLETGAFDGNGNAIAGALTEAMIKGAALGNLQKANSQIGTGQTGNYADYAEVALEDGRISGNTVNATNKRRNELNGENGTEEWDENKIADGQAISSAQQQIKTQGISNSLIKEGQANDDAFRQASMGSEFSGRKEENDLLGIGKKWTELTNHDADDIKLMAKAQDNAAVAAIGGIKATHAELMQHGGVDGAINDMVTGAIEKGVQSSEHAQNMRESYGNDLKGSFQGLSLRETVGEIDQAKIDSQAGQAIATEANKAINPNIYTDNAMYGEMSKQQSTAASVSSQGGIASAVANDVVGAIEKGKQNKAHADNMTMRYGDDLEGSTVNGLSLDETMTANDLAKIDSQSGQAKGTIENMEKNPNIYAQNAQYSEMSKQQSTDAKIAAQGGIDKAVNTDVADAQIKAKQQQAGLTGSMEEFLQSKAGGGHSAQSSKEMAQAIIDGGAKAAENMRQVLSSAGNLAGAQASAKTGGDIVGMEKADEKYKDGGFVGLQKDSASVKTDQQIGSTSGLLNLSDTAKASYINGAMQKASEESPERLAAVMKDFQKAGLIDKDGLVQSENWISGKEYLKANNLNSANALVAGGMIFSGAAGEDASVQAIAMSSLETGSKRTLNNDVVQINNTDAKTQNQLENTGGALVETANRIKTKERLEYEAKFGNQVLDGATDAIHAVTPEGDEEAAAGVAGVAGTLFAAAAATVSAHALDKKYNPETKMVAKVDKQGNPILDADGNVEMVESKTGRGKMFGKAVDVFEGLRPKSSTSDSLNNSSSETKDKTRDDQPNEANDNKSDNGTHKTPPNSDKNSISNNPKSVKETGAEKIKSMLSEQKELNSMDYEIGAIDKAEFSKRATATNNAMSNLESIMSNPDSTANIGMKDLFDSGLSKKSIQENIPSTLVNTKNGKSFPVADLESVGTLENMEIANAKAQTAQTETSDTSGKQSDNSNKSLASKEIYADAAERKLNKEMATQRNEAWSNAINERDNLLSVASSPEAIEKINSDYDKKTEAIKSKYPTPDEAAQMATAKPMEVDTPTAQTDSSSQTAMKNPKNQMAEPPSKANSIISSMANLADSLQHIGKGVILDVGIHDAPKFALKEGALDAAQVYGAISNTTDAFGNLLGATASAAAGTIDALIPGINPIGDATKALNLTQSNNLLDTSKSMMDNAISNAGDAFTNISDIGSNSKSVAGVYSADKYKSSFDSDHNALAPTAQPIKPIETPLSTPIAETPTAQPTAQTPTAQPIKPIETPLSTPIVETQTAPTAQPTVPTSTAKPIETPLSTPIVEAPTVAQPTPTAQPIKPIQTPLSTPIVEAPTVVQPTPTAHPTAQPTVQTAQPIKPIETPLNTPIVEAPTAPTAQPTVPTSTAKPIETPLSTPIVEAPTVVQPTVPRVEIPTAQPIKPIETPLSTPIVETPTVVQPTPTAQPIKPIETPLSTPIVEAPTVAQPTPTAQPIKPIETPLSTPIKPIETPLSTPIVETPTVVQPTPTAQPIKPIETPLSTPIVEAPTAPTAQPTVPTSTAKPIETPLSTPIVEAPTAQPIKPIETPLSTPTVEAPTVAQPTVQTAQPIKPIETPLSTPIVEAPTVVQPTPTAQPIKPIETPLSTPTTIPAEARTVEVSQPINMVSKPVVASEHQGVFSQPSVFSSPGDSHTMQAMQTQFQESSAGNLQTLTSLTQSRSGFFDMKDANGEKISFGTSQKSSDYPLTVDGQNTGMPYREFSSIMQNGETAAQFANAISGTDFTNKDAYITTNHLLQEMSMQSKQADMRQRTHNNASDTNRSIQHKENLQAITGTNEEEV